MKQITPQTVVVGVDVHKFSHTAVALDCWGKEQDQLDFSNKKMPQYLDWLLHLGDKSNIIVALEDVTSYGVHLVKELRKQQYHIRCVPAILTERARRRSTQQDKSDYLDAKRVAQVILTRYEETLPAVESIANEQILAHARYLDLLITERRDLVAQKTVLKNQLHALLHQYYGDDYAKTFSKPMAKKLLQYYQQNLQQTIKKSKQKLQMAQILAQSSLRRINRLLFLEDQIADITKKLNQLAETSFAVKALTQNIHGCGLITACSIVAEVLTIDRFANKAKFAKYAGVAPTQRSSGIKNRLYTNPFGNRKLNAALHTIALGQISLKGNEKAKEYYQKKIDEGKTKLWAMRCMKRHIANCVFATLKKLKYK